MLLTVHSAPARRRSWRCRPRRWCHLPGSFSIPSVSYLGVVPQGASVGAATAILLGVGTTITIQGSALAGGLIAVPDRSIPRLLKNQSTLILVLSGIDCG